MRPLPNRSETEPENPEDTDETDSQPLTEEEVLEGEEKWIRAHEFK